MTAQGYKYLSPPSARTVGILLFTQHISTSLSRIAIHKGLSVRCDSTWDSRTYTVIFVSGALYGLIMEFVVFHYSQDLHWNKHHLLQVRLLSISTSRQATFIYSSTTPQGCYSQNSSPILYISTTYTCQVWIQGWKLTESFVTELLFETPDSKTSGRHHPVRWFNTPLWPQPHLQV